MFTRHLKHLAPGEALVLPTCLPEKGAYLVVQKELCPTTNRLHLQVGRFIHLMNVQTKSNAL